MPIFNLSVAGISWIAEAHRHYFFSVCADYVTRLGDYRRIINISVRSRRWRIVTLAMCELLCNGGAGSPVLHIMMGVGEYRHQYRDDEMKTTLAQQSGSNMAPVYGTGGNRLAAGLLALPLRKIFLVAVSPSPAFVTIIAVISHHRPAVNHRYYPIHTHADPSSLTSL